MTTPSAPNLAQSGVRPQIVPGSSEVRDAVASVDDPEYPGLSIADLGLVESIRVSERAEGSVARIELVPTFSGCPALAVIAADVEAAVMGVDGIDSVEVRWLTTPVWTVDRISPTARRILADEFTVAVRIGDREPRCPRCGSATEPKSIFGPSRCRSVSRCSACRETIEVLRS